MNHNQPYLLENIAQLRLELSRGSESKQKLYQVLLNSVRANPQGYAWFAPFVAVISGQETDIANARQVIFNYMAKLEPMSYSSGLQYHFWCFAFPHAKVALYFQWLCTIKAFSPAEEEKIRKELIRYHFINFYYGMRTKPRPECTDNQALSLVLSTALLGSLFAAESKMASIMRAEGLERLPEIIAKIDPSGYSGEGSSYMDCVNGPAIPLSIELLERETSTINLINKVLEPGCGTPADVLQMIARSWMPGGLLLPWDNYGYQHGVRSTLAYGALKLGDPLFAWLLEHESNLSYDIGIGWAYDDLLWTIIWWPDQHQSDTGLELPGRSWMHPNIGGALVSDNHDYYGALLWDSSTPEVPTRSHVNPGMVLFNAFGVPLSADGSPAAPYPARFSFSDTWQSFQHFIGEAGKYNYGDGCAGAHSVLLIDNNESMRAHAEYDQVESSLLCPQENYLAVDVTPLYQENFPDVRQVKRKMQLHADRIFILEDYFAAEQNHLVAARFLFRPDWLDAVCGAAIMTPEGVTLNMVEVLGSCQLKTENIENHPAKPDNSCRLADYVSEGKTIRHLFCICLGNSSGPESILTDFNALSADIDSVKIADLDTLRNQLQQSAIHLNLALPPHMEAQLPVSKTWLYYKQVRLTRQDCFIRLPLGLINPQLFLDGREIDLEPWRTSMELIRPLVPLPEDQQALPARQLEIILKTDVPISHYEGGGEGTTGLGGGIGICGKAEPELLHSADYFAGRLTVTTNRKTYELEYDLMESEYGNI